MGDKTSSSGAGKVDEDQVNVTIRPLLTINPSFKASGSSAANAQSGDPALQKPSAEDPSKAASDLVKNESANGPSDGHISVFQLPGSDSSCGGDSFTDLDDIWRAGRKPAPPLALSVASDDMPQASDPKKDPEPNYSRGERHEDSPSAGSKDSQYANADEVLEKADPKFTKGMGFNSGTTTLRQEDKRPSTCPDDSKPEVPRSNTPTSGSQAASGSCHFDTADFTPIYIDDQEDAPGRTPAAAPQDYPIDLDDLARKFFGSNTQSSGSKPASGSGNTSVDVDDQVDSPARGSAPAPTPPNPEHRTSTRELFREQNPPISLEEWLKK